MILEKKYSKDAIHKAINEANLIVDKILDTIYLDPHFGNNIEDIEANAIDEYFDFIRLIVDGNTGYGDIPVIEISDIFNREYPNTVIPHYISENFDSLVRTLNEVEIADVSNGDHYKMEFYRIESFIASVAFMINLIDLLAVSDVFETNKCKNLQFETLENIREKYEKVVFDLLTHMMYSALHSKCDTIRNRFVDTTNLGV